MAHKVSAVILAGGHGKRMQTDTAKQYLELKGKPLLYYSIKAFEESCVDEIILVTRAGEAEQRREEYAEQFGFSKVGQAVEGGKERYHSVYEGLKAVKEADIVLIHDGARPLITVDLINRAVQGAAEKDACIVGMPAKETIKIADSRGCVAQTIDRTAAWIIQTPQAFNYQLIKKAYDKILKNEDSAITDDAMVIERMTGHPVHLIEGSYRNIKITTPEDMPIAEALLSEA